jgi:hypothetical protein
MGKEAVDAKQPPKEQEPEQRRRRPRVIKKLKWQSRIVRIEDIPGVIWLVPVQQRND